MARHLNETGVEYALADGYALGAHGYNRFTVDMLPSIAGLTWEEMKPHVTTLHVDDVPVRALDLPGLLKTKPGVRPKDRMDAAIIAEALRQLGKSGQEG